MARLTNWEGAITSHPRVVVRPRTKEDLVEIFREA